jgi:hypothetical protein
MRLPIVVAALSLFASGCSPKSGTQFPVIPFECSKDREGDKWVRVATPPEGAGEMLLKADPFSAGGTPTDLWYTSASGRVRLCRSIRRFEGGYWEFEKNRDSWYVRETATWGPPER